VALEHGVKLTNTSHLWFWKDRMLPLPYLRLTRDQIDSSDPKLKGQIEYLSLLVYPDNYYAYIDTGSHKIPCQATALGGNIDVDCKTDVPGQLVVSEYSWDGWGVKRDGVKVSLDSGTWLTTKAPAGNHHYTFRYRPWDVPLGMTLSLLGIGLAIWLWFQNSQKQGISNDDPVHVA
jgi:hypothetical protein